MTKEKCPSCGSTNILEFEPCNFCGAQEAVCDDCDTDLYRESWDENWERA